MSRQPKHTYVCAHSALPPRPAVLLFARKLVLVLAVLVNKAPLIRKNTPGRNGASDCSMLIAADFPNSCLALLFSSSQVEFNGVCYSGMSPGMMLKVIHAWGLLVNSFFDEPINQLIALLHVVVTGHSPDSCCRCGHDWKRMVRHHLCAAGNALSCCFSACSLLKAALPSAHCRGMSMYPLVPGEFKQLHGNKPKEGAR